jgi:seryl-tRNA synthetase
MIRIAILALGLIAMGGTARAQDVAGIEDCTKTSGLDRRTGCLQSNVNFLQSLVNKNALETAQKLKAAEAEIAALKSAVTSLQKAVEQIRAAQKGAGEKKPESK